MAPSRKKSVSKAAAAAARRQWKVGDLVLAKVKGYPPWPATVSEPEKWGYSADWKKVLVYFFGTQQIAFCNPADVEAFTEEKKQSLLIKPQGKGADFVRAVREIIDSYEKLKKESQVDSFEPGADVIRANTADTSLNFCSKEEKEANAGALDLQTKSDDDTQGAVQTDILTNKESAIKVSNSAVLEIEKLSNAATAETTSPATSRRKNVDTGSKMMQQTEPIRMSRSLSRVQNISAVQDVYKRRNSLKSKSPDASSCDDVGVAALCSNANFEGNCSKIMTVDSDTNGLKECNGIDSKCEVEHPETFECSEGDVQLNMGLQIKAVVVKKKRKASRKRIASDAAKSAIALEKGAIVEVSVPISSQSGHTSCGKIGETIYKEDGEKHLPLLKRARVRMGKSSCDEDLDDFSNVEDRRWKENKTKQSQQTSSVFEGEGCVDGNPSALDGAMDTLPPEKGSVLNYAMDIASPKNSAFNVAVDNSSTLTGSTPIRESGSLQCKLKKDLMFSCSVDGEAALPPSKRLHRALEAMSANAVEEIQLGNKLSPTKESSTGCCISSSRKCPCMPRDSIAENILGIKEMGSASHCGLTGSSNNSNSTSVEIAVRSSEEACVSSQAVNNSISQNHEGCDNVLCGVKDQLGAKDPVTSINSTVLDAQISLHGDTSPNPDVTWSKCGFEQDSSASSLAQNGEGNTSLENPVKASDTSQSMETSVDGLSGSSGTDKASQITICVSRQSKDVNPRENGDSLKPPPASNSKDNLMSVKGVECKILEPFEISLPNPHVGDKTPVGMRFSTSSTDAGSRDGLVEGSPLNASGCNMSTSDSSNNVLQSNGSSSPDIHLNSKKPVGGSVSLGTKLDMDELQRSRSAGKSAEVENTALASFEAAVVTLTRTKESIGRATRMAIDCAKSGVANKVVEILVHTLETESSLHRRIDLFFLVDSITQCSRGLKGDAAVYPSAIQSVLPRLLSAAAPPGSIAQENRRQCLKVLRLWLQRKILPESIVRHHMREIDCYGGSAPAGAYSRRSLRTERALDDPVREMEGMLVDEYGSNSSFQLPGFCMPRMRKDEDEGSDSDGGSFEAVTPEHDRSMQEAEMSPAIEKHRHILEDVDGELEMEDVAPSCDIGVSSVDIDGGGNVAEAHYNIFEKNIAPLVPCDIPPSSPPLPPSPPPPPPPPPPANLLPATPDAYSNDPKVYIETQNDLVQSIPQQLAASRNSQHITDTSHYRGPECREPPLQRPESSSAYGSFYVPPRDQHSSGPVHNKPYSLRPPHHLPSNQFSFINGDHHVKPCREAPPNYSHRHHYEQNMERESYFNSHDRENYYDNHDRKNYYNNHDRMRPPRYEYRDSWRMPAPYSGQRYYDKGMPTPYGCHPREPSRLPGHGWRFPPRSMNHRNPLPYGPPYEGAVPVGSRGQGFWRPR